MRRRWPDASLCARLNVGDALDIGRTTHSHSSRLPDGADRYRCVYHAGIMVSSTKMLSPSAADPVISPLPANRVVATAQSTALASSSAIAMDSYRVMLTPGSTTTKGIGASAGGVCTTELATDTG